MARRLGDELNEMRFQDNLSGSEIVLLYRMPTTKERIAYTNESFQRKGKALVNRSVETRFKYGMTILGGFREGDFEIKQGREYQPIASDPASDNFFPGWKEHIKKYASDLVEHLAIRVFDIPVQVPEEQEEVEKERSSEDEEEDLVKN
jgi:hypothetical protein